MRALAVAQMPYKKAETDGASRMTWTELLAHVGTAKCCEDSEARRQVGNAIAERRLSVTWANQPWAIGGPVSTQADEPPRDARYWQECDCDPDEPDFVREPAPYDRDLVDKRTAVRLDKKRRFRKPVFRREQVSELWPLIPRAADTSNENVVRFPRGSRGRPSERDTVYRILAEMRAEGVPLNKTQKELATIIAGRAGAVLGETKGWDDRTIIQHVSDWLQDNPDPLKR
jgi:hypothetical protein